MRMQPEATSPAPPPAPAERAARFSWKFLLALIVLLAAAFFVGYIPCAMRAREQAATLKKTQLDLRLANLHRLLGVASHEAQRNNYANAAGAARTFFDQCAAIAQTEPFIEEPRTRIALTAYAANRDDVMTHLAMGDPATKERLASMYLTMDGVLGRR